MEARYAFPAKDDLTTLFEEARAAAAVPTWDAFYRFLGVARGQCQGYKAGATLLPERLFQRLLELLPGERQAYFRAHASSRPGNWGRVKGGKATWQKHPEQFEPGRKKGIAKFLKWVGYPRYDIDLNMPLSLDLCEFIGAFIGDGHLSRRKYTLGFAGDKRHDWAYLLTWLAGIAYSLFDGLPHRTRMIKDGNGMSITFNSKGVFDLFTRRFGFRSGRKCYTVRIPEEICSASESNLYAAIRGIFDTDGCVFLDRRPAYKTPYPRILLEIASKGLHEQVVSVLSSEFTLHTGIRKAKGNHSESYYLGIYGTKQLDKWMQLIGFSNERHLGKVREALASLKELKASSGN